MIVRFVSLYELAVENYNQKKFSFGRFDYVYPCHRAKPDAINTSGQCQSV